MNRIIHSFDIFLAILGGLGGILGGILGFILGIRYFTYIGGSTTAAAMLYLIYRADSPLKLPEIGERERRITDAIIFVLIAILIIIFRSGPGVSDLFYWIVPAIFLTLTIRAFIAPTWLVGIQIILFALILRLAIWFSAPVVGRDPRFHVGATKFIIDTGFVIDDPRYYYRNYPVAHILGALLGSITKLNPRQSFFAAVSIPATLTIGTVMVYTKRVVAEYQLQTALLAGLFIAVIPSHVNRTGFPIAQTLGLGLIATVLLAISISNDRRLQLAVFGLITVLIFTHNVSTLTLFLMIASIVLFEYISTYIRKKWCIKTKECWQSPISTLIPLVAIISTLEYWHVIDFFDLQVGRVFRIYFGSISASNEISSASFGGRAYTLGDPILQIGIGLFITTIGLGFATFWMIRQLLHRQISRISTVWTPTALVLFGLIGTGIIAGGTDRIFRLLAGIMLIIAPVVATSFERLGRRRFGIIAVCLLLIVTPILTVIAAENNYRSQLTPPTNRAASDYQNHLTASEITALNFAIQNSDDLRAGYYMSGVALFDDLRRKRAPISETLSRQNLTTSQLSQCGPLTIYRTNYRNYPGIKRPQSTNIVYDSGGATLSRCTD